MFCLGKIKMKFNSPAKLRVVRVVTASETVLYHMDKTLKQLQNDFEVCVMGQDVSKYKKEFPKIKWVDIDIKRDINIYSDFLACIKMYRFFYSYRPDIVHSIMPKAGLLSSIAAFSAKVPIRIHTFTGQVWLNKVGISRKLFILADMLINKLNTVCLTDSYSQSTFLFENGISNLGEPLPVLSKGSLSGVDLSRFDASKLLHDVQELKAKYRILDTQFVFAYIARKAHDKGAIDMLKSFQRVAQSYGNVRLLYIGPDESGGEIHCIIDDNKFPKEKLINVDEVVRNHEVYLAASNILCIPSYREGFGSIVIDAAALGVPAIGTNIVGLRDAIQDNITGMLFEAGDIDQLVELMETAVLNRDRVIDMGSKARLRVEQYYASDHMYMELKKLYKKMLDSK